MSMNLLRALEPSCTRFNERDERALPRQRGGRHEQVPNLMAMTLHDASKADEMSDQETKNARPNRTAHARKEGA